MTPQPVLVLIGPPGAGKTRLGKRVARLMSVPFVDTDRRIVAKHGAIAEIFAEYGEPHFRRIERVEVAKALGEPAVVSLGGGAVLDASTQEDLADKRVALITVRPEVVAERIGGDSRPLLVGGLDAWSRLVEGRRELYERLAKGVWDTSDRPIDQIAHDIAHWTASQRVEEREA